MYRGWNAIINDNLISTVFSLLSVGLALICATLGALLFPLTCVMSGLAVDNSSIASGAIMGGVVGFIVGLVTISCLDSAVAMVFVCFAEDPSVLRENHPQTFDDLMRSWELFNPSSLTWIHISIVETGTASLTQPRTAEISSVGNYHQEYENNPPPYNPSFTGKTSYRL